MAEETLMITIIGGSGFLGRHIVRYLAKQGHRIRVACRRPDLAAHLQPLGAVGQIMAVQANVRYPQSIEAACANADIVINLTGVLYSSGAQSFDAVHVFGARACAAAARNAGASRFIQVSAIGADADASSAYARSKAEGEAAAAAEFPGAVIVRPSLVFGPEDDFFNRFAGLARISPILPLIGGGETRFQPVFVGNIAAAMAKLVTLAKPATSPYELGGPSIYSFRELLEFILKTTGRKRLLLPIPSAVAKLPASVLELLPKPLLTRDQIELLQSDNIVSAAAEADNRTLAGLGISADSIDGIVPDYLYRYRRAGQFSSQPQS